MICSNHRVDWRTPGALAQWEKTLLCFSSISKTSVLYLSLFSLTRTDMLVINVVIIILCAANFGHNFPVTNKKLPSTYDDKECPPGFLPCVAEKDRNVPGPTRGSIPSPASPNTTTAIATETTAPTPSRSSNHSVTETTRKVPPGENMEGTWDSKDGEQQRRHLCPPGIWVCWAGKKIVPRLSFNELQGSHSNSAFLELRCMTEANCVTMTRRQRK